MAKKGTTKYDSLKQEQSVAKDINGRRSIASGALWFSKGDVYNNNILVECKTTKSFKYTFKKSDFDTLTLEALQDSNKKPVMCISIAGKQLAIFREGDFGNSKPIMCSSMDKTLTIKSESLRLDENGILCGTSEILILSTWEHFIELLNKDMEQKHENKV